MPDLRLWLGPSWLKWVFSLALNVFELRALYFVSSLWLFPKMIHCMGWEALD